MKIRVMKIKKYPIGIIVICLLLIMTCFKWLIEGILNKSILEAAFCLALFLTIAYLKKLRIKKVSLIWITFVFNIVLSLFIHESEIGLWGRGAVTCLTILIVMMIDEPIGEYKAVIKLLLIIGIVNAILVVLHYLLKSSFNDYYFPLLNETANNTAQLYTRYGYYFGLLYNPHESAGLIAIGMSAILLWNIIKKKNIKILYIISVLLIVPLLQTGKKAVFICSILAIVLTILSIYGSRKQWLRGSIMLLTFLLLAFVFINYALRHPEVPFLNRFNIFFQSVIARDTMDSGRFLMYERALSEWRQHRLFGIGWRHFNALTVAKFGMTQNHEVNCDYLQWLCETGVVGFMLSIFPVGVTFYRSIYISRNLRKYSNYGDLWVIIVACFIQTFTILYAFVEIPFFDLILFTVYMISCAIINSAYARRRIIHES